MTYHSFLFYSPGGGGGHFIRTLAIVNELHKIDQSVVIYWIINPHFLKRIEISRIIQNIEKLKIFKIKRGRNRKKIIKQMIEELSVCCDTIYVDTFFSGIEEELFDFLNDEYFEYRYYCFRKQKFEIEVDILNQLNNDSSYYSKVFIPNDQHLRSELSIVSSTLFMWTGQVIIQHEESLIISHSTKEKYENKLKLLMVHLGPDEELKKLELIIDSIQSLLPMFEIEVAKLTRNQENFKFPIIQDIISADIVIGGVGYNLVNEIIYFEKLAILLPFERSHDDQYMRLVTLMSQFPNQIFTDYNFRHKIIQLNEENKLKDKPIKPYSINFNGARIIANYIFNE